MSWSEKMIVIRNLSCFSLLIVIFTVPNVCGAQQDSLDLGEDNWDTILTGEWMVAFYAPWCPACKALKPVWEKFASYQKDLKIGVAKVDVTDSPGLSGRFMVTALPTIFHTKDGVFRQYKSPRDDESLVAFVKEKKWLQLEPIPSWKNPNSIQMSVISYFFKLSQILRGMHNRLMEEYGLPTWGSYLIFSVATIIVGAVLGLFIVCLIDFIYPPKPALYPDKKPKDGSGGFMQEKPSGDDELVENVEDDLVDEDASGSDGAEDEKEKDSESKSTPNSPNVRKRKPRKAD